MSPMFATVASVPDLMNKVDVYKGARLLQIRFTETFSTIARHKRNCNYIYLLTPHSGSKTFVGKLPVVIMQNAITHTDSDTFNFKHAKQITQSYITNYHENFHELNAF